MQRYTISRNGQTYGPYSMDELQRYLASGHILPTDLARTDDAPDWIPVSTLLGTPANPGTVPAVGYLPTSGFPDPPNLNWGLVLLLDLVTCSLFQLVWNIVLAASFRRINPRFRALPLYIAAAVLILVQAVSGNVLGIRTGSLGLTPFANINASAARSQTGAFATYALIALACWAVRLLARFTFRSELELHYNTAEPLGIRINPVLTFFFGGIYLQSILNEVNRRKQLQRFGGFGPPR